MNNVINGLMYNESNYIATYNYIKDKKTRKEQKIALTKEINQIKDELNFILDTEINFDKEGKADYRKYIKEHFKKFHVRYYQGYKYYENSIEKIFKNIEKLTKVRKDLNDDKYTVLECFQREKNIFWSDLDNPDKPQTWRYI